MGVPEQSAQIPAWSESVRRIFCWRCSCRRGYSPSGIETLTPLPGGWSNWYYQSSCFNIGSEKGSDRQSGNLRACCTHILITNFFSRLRKRWNFNLPYFVIVKMHRYAAVFCIISGLSPAFSWISPLFSQTRFPRALKPLGHKDSQHVKDIISIFSWLFAADKQAWSAYEKEMLK